MYTSERCDLQRDFILREYCLHLPRRTEGSRRISEAFASSVVNFRSLALIAPESIAYSAYVNCPMEQAVYGFAHPVVKLRRASHFHPARRCHSVAHQLIVARTHTSSKEST